jgi:hypothetical protein
LPASVAADPCAVAHELVDPVSVDRQLPIVLPSHDQAGGPAGRRGACAPPAGIRRAARIARPDAARRGRAGDRATVASWDPTTRRNKVLPGSDSALVAAVHSRTVPATKGRNQVKSRSFTGQSAATAAVWCPGPRGTGAPGRGAPAVCARSARESGWSSRPEAQSSGCAMASGRSPVGAEGSCNCSPARRGAATIQRSTAPATSRVVILADQLQAQVEGCGRSWRGEDAVVGGGVEYAAVDEDVRVAAAQILDG